MKIDFKKTSHVFFFGIILPLSSLFLGWLFYKYVGTKLPYWVETLSPVYFYMALYAYFDKYAWRWPIFRWTEIVTVPDLAGRWKGEQVSSFKKDGVECEKVPTVLEIKQNYSKLIARAYYKSSCSNSVMADFMEHDGEVYLFYTYDNQPNAQKSDTMKVHRGTVKLLAVPGGNRLFGQYFNSMGNIGDVELAFQQKNLLYKFDG